MYSLLETIEATWKGAMRIGQSTETLARLGLEWILGDRPPPPALLRKTFERLGPTYIKLGQFIASAPSLFPPEYVEEFQYCLDRTEEIPYSEIEKILKRELKKDPSSLFANIDKKPIASASIAQVHAAELLSGEKVVLKIQKPEVFDTMLSDLNFLFLAAAILELLAPHIGRESLTAIIADVQKTMMEECDFRKEAQNIKEFHSFLERQQISGVRVPFVYEHISTEKLLVMEHLHGVPLTDLESIKKYSQKPEETLALAIHTWMQSLVFCDFFHADVHAGNLLVLENGSVAFIDFGIVGRISRKTWAALSDLLQSIADKNYKLMAESLISIGMAKTVNLTRFSNDLKNLFETVDKISPSYSRAPGEDPKINRLLIQMIEVSEKNEVRFPREFALLFKQILYFDRYARILAPETNVMKSFQLKLPE